MMKNKKNVIKTKSNDNETFFQDKKISIEGKKGIISELLCTNENSSNEVINKKFWIIRKIFLTFL